MPTIPLFYISRWHNYAWANYGPRYSPTLFTAFTIDQITQTTARIALVPGPAGQWKVAYGPVPGKYSSLSKWVPCQAGIGSQFILTDLQPNTAYYINAIIDGIQANPNGLPISGCYYTDEKTFSTLAPVPPASPVISAITSQPGVPDGSHATIHWNTDILSDSTVHYALNQPPSTLNVTDPALTLSHTIVLPGMNSGGTYQYTVDSATAGGQRTVSAIQTFDQP